MNTEKHNCGNCRHFYNVYMDGTGQCECAHGGISSSDRGEFCKCWAEDYEYEEDDYENDWEDFND